MGMPSRVGPVAILGLLWAAIVVVIEVVVVLVDAAQRNRRAAAEGHQLWEASSSVFRGAKGRIGFGECFCSFDSARERTMGPLSWVFRGEGGREAQQKKLVVCWPGSLACL